MNDPRSITLALHGRWHGSYGLAACPICQPERRKGQNALTIAQKGERLFLTCRKGRCAFRDLLKAVSVSARQVGPLDPAAEARWRAEETAAAEKRVRMAHRVWDDTQPIRGTLAEAYLRSRVITCDLPTSLRFAPSCWYSRDLSLPAMVALVEGGTGFAVHRTYLRPDGGGKANVDAPKKMLGGVMGGAVRLTTDQGANLPLVVAEGIETALSLASGLLDGPAEIWAGLSARGLAGLRLPPQQGRLTVAGDGDPTGRQCALELAERAERLGWDVYLLEAPGKYDWNDVLRASAREVAA
jgi:hypothetical protein